uniref:Uncharacterized protein n=1 Tax=Romanomermis culicivorax TaxID=13658 RepID=A0A915K8D0_ROMCU
MTTSAQILSVIAQPQPLAAVTESRTEVANAFGDMLRPVNDEVGIMEMWSFPIATTPQSLKIGVHPEVHPCRGLVMDFPAEERILSDSNDEE